jgi:hypothetical protein
MATLMGYTGKTHHEKKGRRMTHKTQWMLGVASIVLVASCASTNPPNQKLTETDMVIQAAEAAGGTEFAPLEMREASRKLELARESVKAKKFIQAERQADEARVDAELAHVKAQSAKAQKAAADLKESIRVLQEEIRRSSQP